MTGALDFKCLKDCTNLTLGLSVPLLNSLRNAGGDSLVISQTTYKLGHGCSENRRVFIG